MKQFFRAGIVMLAGTFLSLGCRSTSSTFINRYDNDRVGGISNGQRGIHENAKPFKGIPVTMKVPTHVDVTVTETIYLDPVTYKSVPTERRNLSATAVTRYSDKVFAVDPKKAAAGETKYSFEMKDGYYTQVKQKVTDETISDVNAALVNLLPLLAPKPSPTSQAKFEMGTLVQPETKTRMVAWKRFDINSVDFEDQVKQFVDHHINNCNSCCENTTLAQQ